MLSRTAKIVISILLSCLSVGLYVGLRGKERKVSMIAMILCTLGDLFMVNAFGLGDVSTYPGAAFFMIAHVVYAVGFIKASKRKSYKMANKGFYGGLILVVVSAIGLGVMAFGIEKPQTVMFFLILIYYAIIGFNLVCQFSYACNEKGSRYMLIVAMTLFLVSDFTIFLNMLDVMPAHNDFVWFTYIPAQLLIVLFNSDLKKAE